MPPIHRFVAASLFALSGCASTMIGTGLGDPDRLPEAYGIVAVQVVSNVHRLSEDLENWTALFAVDLADRDKRYRLGAHASGLLGSRVFVGALPPGHYAIYNLHSFRSMGDTYMWLNAPVPPMLGTFRVLDRHVTQLGTFVFQPLDTPEAATQGGGRYLMTRIDDLQDLEPFIARAYPQSHGRMVSELQLGWDSDAQHALREELAERIRGVGFGSRAIALADGRFVLAGKLGRVYWREGDGRWRFSDSGYSNEIGAVAQLGDGVAMAGERGLVLVAPSLQGPWMAVNGPGADEAVEWMRELEDGSLAALTRRDQTVRLYRVDRDFRQWRTLREVEFKRSIAFTGGGEAHAFLAASGRVVLFADRLRIEYDPRSDALSEAPADNMYRLAQMRDGALVALPGHWWSGIGAPQFSRDDGVTWQRFHLHVARESWEFPGGSLPFLLPDGREAVISRKMIRPPGSRRLVPDEQRHLRVSAGGELVESWGEALDDDCLQGLPQVAMGDTLFMLCEDGRIMRSDDAGGRWQLDRDVDLRQDDLPDDLTGRGSQA